MRTNGGYEYRELLPPEAASGTVLAWLADRWRHSPLSVWARRIDEGEVRLDGRRVHRETLPRPGQLLTWSRPPWEEPEVPLHYGILHADEEILAVAKPAGLPTVPGGGYLENTLLYLVRGDWPGASPVHRLGRGTSGIVIFARSRRARAVLAAAWRRGKVVREYLALVEGSPGSDLLEITAPIGPVRHEKLGTVHAAAPVGKPALSIVRVLERRRRDGSESGETGSSGELALVEVRIETGRPHQIRIHLAAAGHPLVGEPLYGEGGRPRSGSVALPGETGYLLHAHRVRLPHPATGTILEIVCPPPPELTAGG